MSRTLERDVDWVHCDTSRTRNMDFLVKYQRMKNAIVFKLSNDVVQVGPLTLHIARKSLNTCGVVVQLLRSHQDPPDRRCDCRHFHRSRSPPQDLPSGQAAAPCRPARSLYRSTSAANEGRSQAEDDRQYSLLVWQARILQRGSQRTS